MNGTDDARELMLADFDAAARTAEALLSRLPPDWQAWRAHPRSRTVAQQAEHLVTLLGYVDNLARGHGHDLAKAAPAREPSTAAPADLSRRFQDATSATASRLASLEEAELEGSWTLSQDGRPIVTLPRCAALQVFLINHLRHHAAQLELSLRLAGLPC